MRENVEPRSCGRQNAGFTLTEMLVVLLIVALATSAASYSIAHRSREVGAVQFGIELRKFLAGAYERALISGRTQSIQYDIRPRAIAMEGSKQQLTIPEGISINLLVGLELVRSDASVQIFFFGQGGSTGARFELSDTKGGEAVVRTNWLTGISILESGNNARD